MDERAGVVIVAAIQPPPAGRVVLSFVEPLVEEWTTWQMARGLAPRTISDRVAYVRRLEDPLGLSPQAVDCVLLNPAYSLGTRKIYHSHIKAWSRWLVVTGRRTDDPTILAPPPKTPKGKPRPLADEHVEALLTATGMYRRTRVMILLGLLAGLRVSEIASIRGEFFDRLSGVLYVTGKGSKERVIPIHPDLLDVVEWMPSRGVWFRSPVGNKVNDAGGQILARTVSTTVSKTMTRAGINARFTPHSLRHTFATRLLRAGVGIEKVRILMGHENLDTTQIYTLVDGQQLGDAIRALPRVPATWIDVSKAFPYED